MIKAIRRKIGAWVTPVILRSLTKKAPLLTLAKLLHQIATENDPRFMGRFNTKREWDALIDLGWAAYVESVGDDRSGYPALGFLHGMEQLRLRMTNPEDWRDVRTHEAATQGWTTLVLCSTDDGKANADSPGLNDFWIAVFMTCGDASALIPVAQARRYYGLRGTTAQWALQSITKQYECVRHACKQHNIDPVWPDEPTPPQEPT